MSYERYRKMQFARQLRKNQTDAEKLVWDLVRDRRCFGLKFRRQFIVRNYVVDFYCPEIKLAIEIDGWHHQLQIEYDEIRQTEIASEGISIIRIGSAEVTETPGILFNRIYKFLHSDL